MWWHPRFLDVPWLGGMKPAQLVPGFLSGTSNRIFAKMPEGASWRVLIHEIFHGFGGIAGVDAGHTFQEVNKAKWPVWYKQVVSSNAGAISELAWYERTARDRPVQDGFLPLKQRLHERNPPQAVFDRAIAAHQKLDPASTAAGRALLEQAAAALKAGSVSKELALLAEAAKIAPDLPEALFTLAYETHIRGKNLTAAIPLYERYIERFSGFDNSDVALVYLLDHYAPKQPERALKLLDDNPDVPQDNKCWSELSLRRAQLHKQLGNAALARELAQSLLADPRNQLVKETQALLGTLK